MLATRISGWGLVVIYLFCSVCSASMTECHVRCLGGRVCVRLPDSNLHLCVRPSLSRRHLPGQRGAGHDVEGRGQSSCPRPPVPAGPCVMQCVYDSDCQQSQACCSNGCGKMCIFVVPGAVSKPGSCPLPSLLESEVCGADCQGDAECPGHDKCCRSHCGTTCQAPCFHWRGHRHASLGGNPWRLSRRCSSLSSSD
ncbi:uncharacterized protein LOC143289549 [Babylonia areolata]|uniref:uncharacterized protein LOC143289549 n=1 Tax=Babylonia areolata TaxID=304850 RepID=UPI003FD0E001